MEFRFWPISQLGKLNVSMLLVVLVVFLLIVDFVRKRRPRNFPPGPQLFPLVGTIVDLRQPLHLEMQKLTARYGNIFSVQFGGLTFVVVSGYQMVREALVHQAEIFADRPHIPLLQEIFRGFGLISSNGHIWRQQRKFVSATLKSIAVSFESKVQEESRYLVEAMEEEKGQPFDPHYKINSAVSNIICSITFGNRFDYHDSNFQELLHLLAETLLLIGSFWGQVKPVCCFCNFKICVSVYIYAHICMYVFLVSVEKVQIEIDAVIGQCRQPTMEDKEHMPYTSAVLSEVLRMGNIVPLGVPRMSTNDTTLAGFHVPKVSPDRCCRAVWISPPYGREL
uniref:Uncharacterized protein n=1 Tax=Pavo cristatus TaxID=9049 RepID=A0A8C9FIB7_PAVCR